MAKKSRQSGLYRLISSKRVQNKLHPSGEREDRVDAEGNRRHIRQDEFTSDGFPWGGGNMGETL